MLCALLVEGRGQHLPSWYHNSRIRLSGGNTQGLQALRRPADPLEAAGVSMDPGPSLVHTTKSAQPEQGYEAQPEDAASSEATLATSVQNGKANDTKGLQSSQTAVDVLEEGDRINAPAEMPEDGASLEAEPASGTQVSWSGDSARGVAPAANITETRHPDSGSETPIQPEVENSSAPWVEEALHDVIPSKADPRPKDHKLMNIISVAEPRDPESSMSGDSDTFERKQHSAHQTPERDGPQRLASRIRDGAPVRQSYPKTHPATDSNGHFLDDPILTLAHQPNKAAGHYGSPFQNSVAGEGGHGNPSDAGTPSPDGVQFGRFVTQDDVMPANEYGGGSNVGHQRQQEFSELTKLPSLYSYSILRKILQAIAFASANYQ